jgi:multidrug resistance efflux pump
MRLKPKPQPTPRKIKNFPLCYVVIVATVACLRALQLLGFVFWGAYSFLQWTNDMIILYCPFFCFLVLRILVG